MNQAKVILLKKIRYSEADIILHGLTSDGQKLSLMARSAVKSRKRFGGGVLEPIHYVQVNYSTRGRSESLHALSEASLIRDFKGLKKDYDKLEMGLFMVGLIDRVTKEGEIGLENLFHLLGNGLSELEKSTSIHKLKLLFEFKLLSYLGIRPQWKEAELLVGKNLVDHATITMDEKESIYISNRVKKFIEEHLNIQLV